MTTEPTTDTGPRFPEIVVDLTGGSGNAMMIVGKVRRALRTARGEDGKRIVTNEEIDEFGKDALSGAYNHVLSTCERWVEVY